MIGVAIALGDVAALDELPVDTVLLCRVREVFQVKRVATFLGEGTGRAWFALGYGDRVWSADEVAEWGPLEVLWRPDVSRETFEIVDTAGVDPKLLQLGALVVAWPRGDSRLPAHRALFVALEADGIVLFDDPDTGKALRLHSADYTFHIPKGRPS